MSQQMLLNLPQEIKYYFIKPEMKDQFLKFCKEGELDGQGNYVEDPEHGPIKGVLAWLEGKNVKRADFWTAEENGALLLIVAVSSGDSDWRGMPGLKKYLLGGYLGPVIKPLPELNIREK
jgi:hypothetical protein